MQKAVDEGLPSSNPGEGLLSGMGIIGEFKNNESLYPKCWLQRAMNYGVEVLKPLWRLGRQVHWQEYASAPSATTCMISAKTWSS